jgi:uncharacterized protein (TIGR00369 family)
MSEQQDSSARVVPEGFILMDKIGGFNDVIAPCYARFRGKEIDLGFFVEAHHCNPMGSCHGGMLMTFVDIMFAGVVCTHIGKFVGTPTININCDFVAGARQGDWLQNETHFLHLTNSVAYIGGSIVGPNGIVLRANGAFRLPK